MAAVGDRVDDVRPPAAPEHVAAPQVAVQARRRLRRPGQVGHPLAHAPRPPARPPPTASRDRGRARAAAAAGARRRTTASPAAGRWAARAGRCAQRLGAAEGVGAGRVDPREPAPQLGLVARPRPARATRARAARQLVASTPSTSGTPRPFGTASQRSPAASAAYSPAGASGARLHERAPAVLQLGRVGVVDVAAADAPQRAHGAAGGLGDGRLEAHTFSAARSSSISPRQAASTMSSTVSKPRSPP